MNQTIYPRVAVTWSRVVILCFLEILPRLLLQLHYLVYLLVSSAGISMSVPPRPRPRPRVRTETPTASSGDAGASSSNASTSASATARDEPATDAYNMFNRNRSDERKLRAQRSFGLL